MNNTDQKDYYTQTVSYPAIITKCDKCCSIEIPDLNLLVYDESEELAQSAIRTKMLEKLKTYSYSLPPATLCWAPGLIKKYGQTWSSVSVDLHISIPEN